MKIDLIFDTLKATMPLDLYIYIYIYYNQGAKYK